MSARRCGECTLCCRVMPVAEIGKDAGISCSQRRSTGCRIYASRPSSCRQWSCMWLLDDSLPLQRPDRAHYIVDPTPDFLKADGHPVGVVQIWVDPHYPEAHRDPALLDWLYTLGQQAAISAQRLRRRLGTHLHLQGALPVAEALPDNDI